MGSLNRKINKRAKRFGNALAAIEKHLKQEQEKSGEVELTKPFDLLKTAEYDLQEASENKRKLRNKRKSEKKKLNKK